MMDTKDQFGEKMPQTIGRYQIQGLLGFGAMGAVYKAFDPLIKRTLAIKTIRLDIPRQSPQYKSFIERFYHEARISGTLSHPNIVTLFDIGEEGGIPYLAMEFVEGETIASTIERGVRFDPEKVISLASQIASAIDYAHGRGVIHRDIKPSNLILYEAERVKVTDFGIAKLADADMTQSGTLLGTPSYMSPEQAMGEKLDGRSDIFSLGVCAFEMLSGEQPFPGTNVTSILYKLVHVDPIEPANLEMHGLVPQKWHEVFGKVLAKKPDDRYQTAAEFVQDLEYCLGSWFGSAMGDETISEASTIRIPAAPNAAPVVVSQEETTALPAVSTQKTAPVSLPPAAPPAVKSAPVAPTGVIPKPPPTASKPPVPPRAPEPKTAVPPKPAPETAAPQPPAASVRPVPPPVAAPPPAADELPATVLMKAPPAETKVPPPPDEPPATVVMSTTQPMARSIAEPSDPVSLATVKQRVPEQTVRTGATPTPVPPRAAPSRSPAPTPAVGPEPPPTTIAPTPPATIPTTTVPAMESPRRPGVTPGAILGIAGVVFALALGVAGYVFYRNWSAEPAPATPAPPAGEPAASPTPLPAESVAATPTGALHVESQPPGATLTLNGEGKGPAPADVTELPFGDYDVRLELKGYQPFSQRLTLGPDTPRAEVKAVLKAAGPAMVVADILSTPFGATVTLDGAPIGQTPLTDYRLKPGPHQVTFVKDGYEPGAASFKAEVGKRARVDVQLKVIPKATPTPKPVDEVDTNRVYNNLASEVDVQAKKISGPGVTYPANAPRLRSGESVSCSVSFVVNELGEVTDFKIVESGGALVDETVATAVRSWKYSPAVKKGVKVKVRVMFKQTFRTG